MTPIIWIIIGVVVVALAVFAFWPRKRGIRDRDVTSSRSTTEGQVGNYDNPGFGGF